MSSLLALLPNEFWLHALITELFALVVFGNTIVFVLI